MFCAILLCTFKSNIWETEKKTGGSRFDLKKCWLTATTTEDEGQWTMDGQWMALHRISSTDYISSEAKSISVMISGIYASWQIRKIAGAHASGMPGTFSPPPQVSDPDMHHGTCVLSSGFLWNRWVGKTFPAYPAHAQPAILRSW